MNTLLVSTGVVALAEMGDKTQLLALLLAGRYGRKLPVALGILVATLANHALAGAAGAWLSGLLDPRLLQAALGLSFLAMAAWALVPDRLDAAPRAGAAGVFAATLVAFFLVEIGDKTQLATVALAAHHTELAAVVVGTTLGMMLANLPAVWLGDRLLRRLPLRACRFAAAAVFAALGLLALAGTLR